MAASFLHLLLLVFISAALCSPRVQPSLFFLGVFALLSVPVDVVLTDCSNQPFPRFSAAKFSILLSEHRQDAGPFLAASWARI